MTSHFDANDSNDQKYFDKLNLDLVRTLPFQVQPIDGGRFILMVGFAGLLAKDHTEEDVFEAMKRIAVDILKIAEVIEKKDKTNEKG